MRSFLFSALCSLLVACTWGNPTRFEGSARFPDGADGCRRTCQASGLDFGGFVYSGEFSTSCVCTPHQSAPGASGATAPPTAGVIVQAQAAAAAATANQQMMMAQQQRQQQQMHH